MTIIYEKENGYFIIDIHSEPFQLGRKLYEAQCLLSEKDPIQYIKDHPEKAQEMIHWFCELVANVGQLRAEYGAALEVLNGRAVFDNGNYRTQRRPKW